MTMEPENMDIEELKKRTESFLITVEQEVRAGRVPKANKSQKEQPHPEWDTLRAYVRCRLHEDEATAIREHLAYCRICARKALCIVRLEREEKTQPGIWEDWVKSVISIPAQVVRGVSDLWQPTWTGVLVSANDIPEQKRRFTLKDGEIELTCLWRSQYGTNPAHIELSWVANLSAERELWALFFDPETKDVLAEISLGTYLQGGKSITSEALGFDPSNEPWAISILLKERDP